MAFSMWGMCPASGNPVQSGLERSGRSFGKRVDGIVFAPNHRLRHVAFADPFDRAAQIRFDDGEPVGHPAHGIARSGAVNLFQNEGRHLRTDHALPREQSLSIAVA